jgi:hypothetical protein
MEHVQIKALFFFMHCNEVMFSTVNSEGIGIGIGVFMVSSLAMIYPGGAAWPFANPRSNLWSAARNLT